jgi:hypothetical protein
MSLLAYLRHFGQRDILKADEYIINPTEIHMASFDTVKQNVEAALEAVEVDIENEVAQVIKAKLLDLQSFLNSQPVDTTPPTDAPVAPEAPVDPAAPVEPPVDPAPVDDLLVSEIDPSVPSSEPQTPPTDVVTPPVDGSEPVTNEAGEPVNDPNAPR